MMIFVISLSQSPEGRMVFTIENAGHVEHKCQRKVLSMDYDIDKKSQR